MVSFRSFLRPLPLLRLPGSGEVCAGDRGLGGDYQWGGAVSKELFEDSHKVLTELVRWLGSPIITVHPSVDPEILRNIAPGNIIRTEEPLNVLHQLPLTDETMNILVRAFCESHGRIEK